jgi:hypothetical protein
MGIKVTEDNFFTSSQATALYLNKHFPNKKIYCMGTASMIAEMEKYGVNITTQADEDTDCICVGYDTELTYKKLWEAEDCDLEKTKLLALIREDVEKQKVYAYNKGAEVLLYDLGAEIGDTIEVLNWLYQIKYLDSTNVQDKEYYFSYLVVDNIDYIEDETYGNLNAGVYIVKAKNSNRHAKIVVK